MKRRVVVTGLGVVSSIGIGKEEFWKNLTAGRSGIGEVARFDTKRYKRHFGGDIKDFSPEDFIHKKSVRYVGRATQLGIAGVKLALEDAKINPAEMDERKKTCIILGTTMPEDDLIDHCTGNLVSRKTKNISKNDILNHFPHSLIHNISHFLKIKCNGLLIPNACGAGNFAIGYAFDLISKGAYDLGIVGGTESFSRIAFQGFQAMRAMAEQKCSPFDKNRQGMLLGEGSGILILEEYGNALKRNAPIYGEVLGYGQSCDARSMTIPQKEGVFKSMKKALDNSGVSADKVDYISAHGTATIANDKNESAAIKELFGSRYNNIPVSSIKSMLGHTMGAASAIEAAVCCLAIERGVIPPTINYETQDPDCGIDCVPGVSRKYNVDVALNNGFAFGGNNCCVVFKKPGPAVLNGLT